MDDKIEVIFFPCNARCFLLRCMLETGGIKYNFKVITFEEWDKMEKPTEIFEYGLIPIITINGKSYSQAFAFNSYVAKKYGFSGSNSEEEYEILNVLASWEDIIPSFVRAVYADTKEISLKIYEEMNKELLPWILPVYERKLNNRKGKYLVGDKLSAADMHFAYLYSLFIHPCRFDLLKDAVEKYSPSLMKFGEEILKNDCIKHYNGSFYKDAEI